MNHSTSQLLSEVTVFTLMILAACWTGSATGNRDAGQPVDDVSVSQEAGRQSVSATGGDLATPGIAAAGDPTCGETIDELELIQESEAPQVVAKNGVADTPTRNQIVEAAWAELKELVRRGEFTDAWELYATSDNTTFADSDDDEQRLLIAVLHHERWMPVLLQQLQDDEVPVIKPPSDENDEKPLNLDKNPVGPEQRLRAAIGILEKLNGDQFKERCRDIQRLLEFDRALLKEYEFARSIESSEVIPSEVLSKIQSHETFCDIQAQSKDVSKKVDDEKRAIDELEGRLATVMSRLARLMRVVESEATVLKDFESEKERRDFLDRYVRISTLLTELGYPINDPEGIARSELDEQSTPQEIYRYLNHEKSNNELAHAAKLRSELKKTAANEANLIRKTELGSEFISLLRDYVDDGAADAIEPLLREFLEQRK